MVLWARFNLVGTAAVPTPFWAYLAKRHLKYFCGSGFPAAISDAAMKADRGWEAAPTIHKVFNLINIEYFHINNFI
jgi:hypothetical protein